MKRNYKLSGYETNEALALAVKLGFLTLPNDRRFRKCMYHETQLDDGANIAVAVSNSRRLYLDEEDIKFLKWMVERADSESFIPFTRLKEFELSRGRRDIDVLTERLERCALVISIRLKGCRGFLSSSCQTILAYQMGETITLGNIYFEPKSNKDGVWIDSHIIKLIIKAL